MFHFYYGENRYVFQENSKELVEKLVLNLNSLFGSKKCPFHEHGTWDIGVDLMKDGRLQFSTMKKEGCSYASTLIDEDIKPFLEGYGIFPLPSH